jgi:hypothetical protein
MSNQPTLIFSDLHSFSNFMTQINEKQYGILSDFFLIYLYYIIVE